MRCISGISATCSCSIPWFSEYPPDSKCYTPRSQWRVNHLSTGLLENGLHVSSCANGKRYEQSRPEVADSPRGQTRKGTRGKFRISPLEKNMSRVSAADNSSRDFCAWRAT